MTSINISEGLTINMTFFSSILGMKFGFKGNMFLTLCSINNLHSIIKPTGPASDSSHIRA